MSEKTSSIQVLALRLHIDIKKSSAEVTWLAAVQQREERNRPNNLENKKDKILDHKIKKINRLEY